MGAVLNIEVPQDLHQQQSTAYGDLAREQRVSTLCI